jgi:hypothetical protein
MCEAKGDVHQVALRLAMLAKFNLPQVDRCINFRAVHELYRTCIKMFITHHVSLKTSNCPLCVIISRNAADFYFSTLLLQALELLCTLACHDGACPFAQHLSTRSHRYCHIQHASAQLSTPFFVPCLLNTNACMRILLFCDCNCKMNHSCESLNDTTTRGRVTSELMKYVKMHSRSSTQAWGSSSCAGSIGGG